MSSTFHNPADQALHDELREFLRTVEGADPLAVPYVLDHDGNLDREKTLALPIYSLWQLALNLYSELGFPQPVDGPTMTILVTALGKAKEQGVG